jgi:hypothetical protein
MPHLEVVKFESENMAASNSASPEAPARAGGRARSHHLLKHVLPHTDVKTHFGTVEPKEIVKEINRMGQKELQVSISSRDLGRVEVLFCGRIVLRFEFVERSKSLEMFIKHSPIPIITTG